MLGQSPSWPQVGRGLGRLPRFRLRTRDISRSMRRAARPLACTASIGLLRCHATMSQPAPNDLSPSQAVAAAHVATLGTSDGTPYTLEYLDRSKRFSVWRGTGSRSTFSEMLASAATHDVVHLGETHYDAIAHKLQEILFARLAAMRPACILSLEMFEADVQQCARQGSHAVRPLLTVPMHGAH